MMRVTTASKYTTSSFYAQVKVEKFHCEDPGAAHHINAVIFDTTPFTQYRSGNLLEILVCQDAAPLKGG
jgi:hypothetical protein